MSSVTDIVTSLLPAKEKFQQSIEGRQTDLFFLCNAEQTQVALTNYGARIVSILVKDKTGISRDVVIGFDSLNDYLNATEIYHGAIIGRYANRIANGQFRIGAVEYKLPVNNGSNHLHGGIKGFHNVVWEADKKNEKTLVLQYLSKDGEEGYPGNVHAQVTYTLTDSNELKISFKATTDQTTVINLTNHAYFNLNGLGSGTILDHLLEINADQYTPIDESLIPLGALQSVADTPFDFRKPTTIGKRINEASVQLKNGNGYDHNFVLNKINSTDRIIAAKAIGIKTGIVLEVETTEPGLQLYTGNFMQGEHTIKGGIKDEYRTGFCLETQHFPDAPNQPSFPSTILQPDEIYQTETVFRFSTIH